MPRSQRIALRETRHYVKFCLASEQPTRAKEENMAAREATIRRMVAMHPPLLAWVARARMMANR